MTDTMITAVSRNDHHVYLDVKRFCENIIIGVEKWIETHKDNPVICAKISALPNVYEDTKSLPFVYTIGPR